MEKRGMEPIIIEDLVKFGEDRGIERGALKIARRSVLDALEVRGFAVEPAVRARVDGESSLDLLRTWLKRAIVAASVAEVFEAQP